MRSHTFFLLLLLGLSSACEQEQAPGADVAGTLEAAIHSTADLTIAPLTAGEPADPLSDLRRHFFRPWTTTRQQSYAWMAELPGRDTAFLRTYLADPDYYGPNKLRHSNRFKAELAINISAADFPNAFDPAITVRNTDIRRLPTIEPAFDRPAKAGEGYPFDYFQESAVWANTPVLIVHYSLDRAWAFALTPFYKGWISTSDLALADQSFIDRWQESSLWAVIDDHAPLVAGNGRFLARGRIGMWLPKAAPGQYWAAAQDTEGRAIAHRVDLSPGQIAPLPLPFQSSNLQALLRQIEGEPYGWGGYLGNRDCSATIRDLMLVFGKWLPRNSADQAVCGHTTLQLPENPEEKLRVIREKGVPFRTILYKQGHSMLYAGLDERETPLIFHTIWGLKPLFQDAALSRQLENYPLEGIHADPENDRLYGRYVIGRSVLTTVHLGRDIPHVPTTILEDLQSMTVF